MTDERCENCRFWKRPVGDAEEDGIRGVCRAHPPTDGFSFVDNDDWCGEHQPIEPKAPGDDRVATSSSSPGGVNAELLTALTYLSNEVLGKLSLVGEKFLRREMGDTNFNILVVRAQEIRALIVNLRKLTEQRHE